MPIEKFDVFARWTGALMFSAEIECDANALRSVKLGLAVKWALKTGARLDGASLVGARLDGASLDGASLVGASLDGAKLSGGFTVKSVVAIVARICGGYVFHGYETDGGLRIIAGCRNFSPAEYRQHIADEYPDTKKAEETLAIIAFIEARAAALAPAAKAEAEAA